MLRNKLLMVALMAAGIFSAQAQESGALRGKVFDQYNHPVPGVTVSVKSVDKEDITDMQGNYTLSGIPEGAHEITVSGIGLTPAKKEVTVAPRRTDVVDFIVEAGITSLPKMVVSTNMQGQSKALNVQKNHSGIANIISSDQVGRFPDANVGDALKRIAGVNVQYDQGEARFGNIRGTAPQYNSVTINGERIPSAEAEGRTVQLDLVPSDMIQALEVNKAVTPDMDADAIGGSVNLVTRTAPYDRRISLTLGSGYNLVANLPMLTGGFVFGDRFFDKKFGIVASGSYHNHHIGSDNFEAEWNYLDEDDKDNSAFAEEIQIRQYYLQRIRQSYSLALDYKLTNNHTLFASGIYNWRNDWESRFRTIYQDIEYDESTDMWSGEMRKETKGGNQDTKYRRLEAQRMMSFSLGGEHLIGKLAADWAGSYSKASEHRPNERYIGYRNRDVAVVPDFSNTNLPKISVPNALDSDFSEEYSLRFISEEFQYTEDIDQNFKLDLELPILENEFKNSLKVGGRYRGKQKMRDNKLFEYEPVDEDAFNAQTLANLDDISKDNFLAGDYRTGEQVSKEYLGDLDLTNSALFDEERVIAEQAGNFNATEAIVAGYLMLNQEFGDKFSAVVGVRAERTSQEYQGNQYDADEDEITETDKVYDSYINILPGIHLKFDITNSMVARAAWTNTLARPNYFSLVPYREVSREDNEIAIGNPELTPTKSMNFDISLEHYFQSIGIVSIGAFYKDISDFIVDETKSDYTFEGTTWDQFAQPINGGNATIIGIELAAQRQLDFLPGFLSGFGLYANYTHTISSISDFQIEGREDEELPLPGSAQHTLNTSLSYDAPRFTARISLNYSSAFAEEFGEEEFFDIYYDKAMHLDFNGTFAITPKLRLYVDALNLLDQPLAYFQGDESRTYQREYYNRRFQGGLKLDL